MIIDRRKDRMRKSASVKIVLCGIFVAFTCICAMISIPFGPVPINMVHIAIFISAWVLGPYLAFVTQLIYIFIGILGVPVFSNFLAGLGHILGPTGGFIMAYPVVALLSGMIFKVKKLRGTVGIILGMFIGWIVEYGMGTVYYSYVTTVSPVVALSVCVVPFIFGDICKSILIFTLCKRLKL